MITQTWSLMMPLGSASFRPFEGLTNISLRLCRRVFNWRLYILSVMIGKLLDNSTIIFQRFFLQFDEIFAFDSQ